MHLFLNFKMITYLLKIMQDMTSNSKEGSFKFDNAMCAFRGNRLVRYTMSGRETCHRL